VIFSQRETGKATGFGFRNYWFPRHQGRRAGAEEKLRDRVWLPATVAGMASN